MEWPRCVVRGSERQGGSAGHLGRGPEWVTGPPGIQFLQLKTRAAGPPSGARDGLSYQGSGSHAWADGGLTLGRKRVSSTHLPAAWKPQFREARANEAPGCAVTGS